jgi:DNA-binding NarL/FixJ family response regulator
VGERVLIVEDDPVQQINLEVLLEMAGHAVCGKQSTGEGALVAAEVKQPDVAIVDVRLGGPLDGIETARSLRDLYRSRVIFLTAYADPETVARMRALAPDAVLVKPADPKRILAAVDWAGRSKSAQSERHPLA